jgi:hypothetical protein
MPVGLLLGCKVLLCIWLVEVAGAIGVAGHQLGWDGLGSIPACGVTSGLSQPPYMKWKVC